MKKLDLYQKLGLHNEEQVFSFFMDSLRESIFTWDYFVDWKKIAKKINRYKVELNILNSLVGEKNSEKMFISLMKEYPHTKRVLPLLIAVRIRKLDSLPIVDNKDVEDNRSELKIKYFKINREIDSKAEKELKRFYVESGLKTLLEQKNIKNLVDYYTGIEVGMDTNARKNRTGDLMEDIVENYLISTFSQERNIEIVSQANKEKIENKFGIAIQVDKVNRRFDFTLLNKNSGKLILMETNYYSGGGTKLKATAGEYRQLAEFLEEQGLVLVWVTDGLGWKTAQNSLRETFRENDFVFNLALLNKGALKEILFCERL